MKESLLAGFDDFSPPRESFRDAVLTGLDRPRKAIPSKFIYDAEGSRLFEAIPTLDEYYQTRTEVALLRAHAGEIAQLCGPACYLVEYGSGSSNKVRILLDVLESPSAYVPMDISRDHLRIAAEGLAGDYPHIPVHAVCADFSKPFNLPNLDGSKQGRRIGFFPGASIGNFTLDESAVFLSKARETLAGGGLLIGIDLKKDVAVLEAAYNDSKGASSAFNLNLLGRIVRELDAKLDVSAFRHHAVYNREKGRIEIGIESLRDQSVTILGREFLFRKGEIIHTQHAYKFSIDEFQTLAAEAGFATERIWRDDGDLYALFFLRVRLEKS